MAFDHKILTYLTLALGVIAVGLTAMLTIQPGGIDSSRPLRGALAAGVVIACGLACVTLSASVKRKQLVLRRLIGQLCELDSHNVSANQLVESAAEMSMGEVERETLGLLGTFIEQQQQRLDDAEHARRSAEVRLNRLVNEHRQVSRIVSEMSDPVLAIDQHGTLMLANSSARKLLQLPSDGAEHRAISQLIHCEELLDLLSEAQQRKSLRVRTGEIHLQDAEGEARSFRVVCNSLDAANGHADGNGTVAVLNDISTEKAIQRRNAEFVSSVSHEMKTPLAGIKAYVELLLDGEADDSELQEEFLGVISGQADRLQRLVENLLNLARMEAGVVDVDKQILSLNELLAEACEVVQPRAEQKRLELKVDLSPMYLGTYADRDMLLQVAINLLSNAIKYTPEDGVVYVRSRLSGNDVLMEVEDTGVGLSGDDCARVFEKFYRVKKDAKMAGGTGLGLPLAKHIVEDVHGGQISVISEEGKGSTFRVALSSAKELGN